MLSKFQLFIIVLFISISLSAQDALNKGVYTLSGSATYSSTNSTYTWTGNDDNVKTTTISITPSFGYFIIDNLQLRSNISFFYKELSLNNTYNNIDRNYTIGVGVKYYFRMNNLSPFISADYGYSNATTGSNDANSFIFAGGLNFFISNSVALEPFVQYSTRNSISYLKNQTETSIGIRIVYFIIN
ncbi:MAG: porin family protein [Melioribacteraceae bacterium]|nr:porin family protein [Melioribacteraceae bacterium]